MIQCRDNQAKMITHNTPAMKPKPFMLLAVTKTINNNITIAFTHENIHLINHCKRNKMNTGLVPDLVTTIDIFHTGLSAQRKIIRQTWQRCFQLNYIVLF
jgi:hypothetical protein